jgi:hypothetical protein
LHDHSGKVKHTKATDDIQPNPYLGYTDVTEKFFTSLEAESACVKNVTEKLDTSLSISKSQSVATEKSNKDLQCDLCGRYYTTRGFNKHRNDCVTKPQNHIATRKN